MFSLLLSLFSIKKPSKRMEEQHQQQLFSDDEDTYEQGYQDALDEIECGIDADESYDEGYQDALDDIDMSEECEDGW